MPKQNKTKIYSYVNLININVIKSITGSPKDFQLVKATAELLQEAAMRRTFQETPAVTYVEIHFLKKL
ncbi:unnamed protein product [Macrosiphum euphorbiae]|uniref:Uncharacterized protein n=1 Tax=Macrosiphum euphorbiae TaxID=13131 RepID=A0AAV0X4V3_9HEMI|nr:unnamed protein product [Macrosiphum euphorbiae]